MISLSVRYALFAGIATLANLASQWATLALVSGRFALYAAIAVGTFAGLVTKYVLDKHYIFNCVFDSRREDVYKFLLYSFMGVFTTAIFWGFELLFDTLLRHEAAKYWGAAIGLTIGYATKYQLDKRYVFVKP